MFPIRDTISSRSFPLVNWVIIVINVLIYLLETSLDKETLALFIDYFALVPAEIRGGGWPLFVFLPFFSNMFLHSGIVHLISNMWTLVIFGDNVEDQMGHGRYLVFYVLCGILASVTHYLFNINSDIPALGASGAIAGVMGAYMLLFRRSKIVFLLPILFFPFFFKLPAFIYLAYWFAVQFLSVTADTMTNTSGGVAYWAHIGGFLAGLVLHRLFIKKDKYRPDYKDEYFLKFNNRI